MTNKLHPQELADLLQKPVAMDRNGVFFAYDSTPKPGSRVWGFDEGEHAVLEITHAIAKPDDCPEWDKAIWEPRVTPERGKLCEFWDYDSDSRYYGHFAYVDVDGTFRCSNGALLSSWKHCKPIDSVPVRIDLDAQRGGGEV